MRVVTAIWLFAVAMLVISYARTVSTDPGVVTPELSDELTRAAADRATRATFPEMTTSRRGGGGGGVNYANVRGFAGGRYDDDDDDDDDDDSSSGDDDGEYGTLLPASAITCVTSVTSTSTSTSGGVTMGSTVRGGGSGGVQVATVVYPVPSSLRLTTTRALIGRASVPRRGSCAPPSTP